MHAGISRILARSPMAAAAPVRTETSPQRAWLIEQLAEAFPDQTPTDCREHAALVLDICDDLGIGLTIPEGECAKCGCLGSAEGMTSGECRSCHARDMEMEARYDESRD